MENKHPGQLFAIIFSVLQSLCPAYLLCFLGVLPSFIFSSPSNLFSTSSCGRESADIKAEGPEESLASLRQGGGQQAC